jgi:hypothetical protein
MGWGAMVPLPPDLSRLGDELTAATARALDQRRRRRRLVARAAACALAGMLTIIALAPTAVSPAQRSAALLAQEPMHTVLVRLPDRPPLLRPHEQTRPVFLQLPERPPRLPAVAFQRDA